MSYDELTPGFPRKLIYAWFRDPTPGFQETDQGCPVCVHFKAKEDPVAKLQTRRGSWIERQVNDLGASTWTPQQREELMSIICYGLVWGSGREFLYRRLKRIPRSLVLAGAGVQSPGLVWPLGPPAPPKGRRREPTEPKPPLSIRAEAPKKSVKPQPFRQVGGPNPDILQMIETMGNRWFD